MSSQETKQWRMRQIAEGLLLLLLPSANVSLSRIDLHSGCWSADYSQPRHKTRLPHMPDATLHSLLRPLRSSGTFTGKSKALHRSAPPEMLGLGQLRLQFSRRVCYTPVLVLSC